MHRQTEQTVRKRQKTETIAEGMGRWGGNQINLKMLRFLSLTCSRRDKAKDVATMGTGCFYFSAQVLQTQIPSCQVDPKNRDLFFPLQFSLFENYIF